MLNLVFFENGENRAPKADQGAARNRGWPLGQRLELQAGAVVVEQDAAIEITDDDCLGQLGHQRSEAVFLFLNRGLGAGNLGVDIIHQHIALLRQIIGGAGQLLDFRRAFRVTRKLRLAPSIRRRVSAMRNKPSTYCLNSLCRTSTPMAKPNIVIIVPTGRRDSKQLGQHRALGFAHVEPDQQRSDNEWPGHQQTEHYNNDKTVFSLHGIHPDDFAAWPFYAVFGRRPGDVP
jgi:hypothetical protein